MMEQMASPNDCDIIEQPLIKMLFIRQGIVHIPWLYGYIYSVRGVSPSVSVYRFDIHFQALSCLIAYICQRNYGIHYRVILLYQKQINSDIHLS